MQLRNCILIALAFDATQEEINAAHDVIDRIASGQEGIDPKIIVAAQVSGTTGTVETTGTGVTINAAAGAQQLDADGLPWDARIHSSNKKLDGKGKWWARRNTAPATVVAVEAELRAALGAAPVTSAPPAATPTPTPAASNTPPLPGATMPPMPGANVVDPAYTALIALIAANTQSSANPAGKLTDEYVTNVLKHYGVPDGNLQNLAHAPQLIPTISEWFTSVLK